MSIYFKVGLADYKTTPEFIEASFAANIPVAGAIINCPFKSSLKNYGLEGGMFAGTNSTNGSVLSLDGATQIATYNSSTDLSSSPFTIFARMKLNSVVAPRYFSRFFYDESTQSTGGGVGIITALSAGSRFAYHHYNTVTVTNGSTNTSEHLWVIKNVSPSSTIIYDSTTTAGTTTATHTLTGNKIILGSKSDTDIKVSMTVRNLVIYPWALSDDERSAVTSYLNT